MRSALAGNPWGQLPANKIMLVDEESKSSDDAPVLTPQPTTTSPTTIPPTTPPPTPPTTTRGDAAVNGDWPSLLDESEDDAPPPPPPPRSRKIDNAAAASVDEAPTVVVSPTPSSRQRRKRTAAVRDSTSDRRRSDDGATKRTRSSPPDLSNIATVAMFETPMIEEIRLESSTPVSMTDRWSTLIDAKPHDADAGEMDDEFMIERTMVGALDGSEVRSVYSLLARIDVDKCADEYSGLANANAIRRAAESVLWALWRLGRFTRRHDIGVNMSDRTWFELNGTFDGTVADAAAIDGTVSIVDGGAAEARRNQLREDDDVSDARGAYERAKILIGQLDHKTKDLLLRLGQVRAAKFFRDLLNERMTALNFLDDSKELSYNNYAMTRMRFSRFRDDTAFVNGFYLISLKYATPRYLKFPVYDDRFNYLSEIASGYVRRKLFDGEPLPPNVRVFVNLSMLQTCANFNVLKVLPNDVLTSIRCEDNAMATRETSSNGGGIGGGGGTAAKKAVGRNDIGGVLGLVQFGNIKYDPKTEHISVRGYVTATFSSTNE